MVCRDTEGRLRAFHNVCRHHASLLARDSGRKLCFVCPYHVSSPLRSKCHLGDRNPEARLMGRPPELSGISLQPSWYCTLDLQRISIYCAGVDLRTGRSAAQGHASQRDPELQRGRMESRSFMSPLTYAIALSWLPAVRNTYRRSSSVMVTGPWSHSAECCHVGAVRAGQHGRRRPGSGGREW